MEWWIKVYTRVVRFSVRVLESDFAHRQLIAVIPNSFSVVHYKKKNLNKTIPGMWREISLIIRSLFDNLRFQILVFIFEKLHFIFQSAYFIVQKMALAFLNTKFRFCSTITHIVKIAPWSACRVFAGSSSPQLFAGFPLQHVRLCMAWSEPTEKNKYNRNFKTQFKRNLFEATFTEILPL